MKRLLIGLIVLVAVGLLLGLPNAKQTARTDESQIEDPMPNPNPLPIKWMLTVEDFDKELAVFETVFWDARDTVSLRAMIREEQALKGKDVLEIGTGSGLLALCCLKAKAKKVIATDVNDSAIKNANHNAAQLGLAERLETRLVPLDDCSAFSVIKESEKFDLIVSNPPWVNQRPASIDEYALYDEDFGLMKSLFEGLEQHLKPGGRVLLAYGCVDAIRSLEKLAKVHGFEYIAHDSRDLDQLPEEFLPGYLVEIRLKESE